MYKRTILLICIFLASCRSGITDVGRELPIREVGRISTGKITGMAWVSRTTMVFEVDEGSIFENQRVCSQQFINIYEMGINQMQSLPSPFENDCKSYIFRDLQVLPNQKAGYIFEYPKSNSIITIKSVNVKNGAETDLYHELTGDSSFNRFSYSSDMKELLYVDAQGAYLKSAIYLMSSNGDRTNITSDFLRADFPAWSQKNNQVAFLGTKPYPGSDDKVENFSQTESRLDYPWRIYLYDPENLTTKELPLDIVHPSSLKWSPDGNMIAFSGEYRGIPGIWIVENLADPNDLTINRIADGLATFDFSPDSKSIAFAYIGLENTERQNILYVVNINMGR